MTIVAIQCAESRHFWRHVRDRNLCDASPDSDGLLATIIKGRHDHRAPDPGDRGIVFEPVEATKAATRAEAIDP